MLPPTIDEFSVSPPTLNEGESIQCSATASDPGDDILTYQWDFGDDSTSSEQNPTHVYADDDSYTVTLIVTDDDEDESEPKTQDVTVSNVAPTIDDDTFSISPTTLNEGGSIICNATASDPGDDILIYQWDFGDESDIVAGQSVNHVYANNGDYIVTLTVTDGDGGSDEKTQEVTVKNGKRKTEKLEGD